MPESLLQNSIKVANEVPADMRSNLRRAWANFSQEWIDECAKDVNLKGCLFTLCFYHALVGGMLCLCCVCTCVFVTCVVFVLLLLLVLFLLVLFLLLLCVVTCYCVLLLVLVQFQCTTLHVVDPFFFFFFFLFLFPHQCLPFIVFQVQGRRRFGQQGWSKKYSFNVGDLTVCAQVLKTWIGRSEKVICCCCC